MSPRARSRSSVPVECRHKQVRHEHGSSLMYISDGCGCDACTVAYSTAQAERRDETKRAEASDLPSTEITARGQFVATFPAQRGMTRTRLARHHRWDFYELAAVQGVELLPGDPTIRVDRTGAGEFVVMSQAAVSRRPVVEVRSRAAEMAYEHEQAHPLLAKWITKHLQGVA